MKFGDSAQMQPGDWVMAIGNPFGLAHTVSVGVISADRRDRSRLRNSRSPTCCRPTPRSIPATPADRCSNVRGEVIGINTAIYTDARQQGNIGIGFAIPINIVRDLLPQLRVGKVTRGVIGVSVPIGAGRRARRVRTEGAHTARSCGTLRAAVRRPRPVSSRVT